MNNKSRLTFPAVGGSFLLVIFTVLCLLVFAMLALSTAQADRHLGDLSAQASAAYYTADCRAEAILAQLRSGNIPPQVTEENGLYRYECPISDTQSLFVTIQKTNAGYQVLQWQAVYTAAWETDDHIQVWNGEAPDEP